MTIQPSLDSFEAAAIAPLSGEDGMGDLEALLEDSRTIPDADPLEDLLAESMAATKEAQAAKAARERIKRGGLTAKEREADEERIRRWELQNEWRAVANVALFERHRCNCGRQQTIFRQLMERQEHRHLRGSFRWQKTTASKAGLPNEIVVQKWETPMCTYCSTQAGFDFSGSVKEWEG